MRPRLVLHEILVGLLGTRNVYFQPPPSFKMVYPCIIYNRNNIRTNFADNRHYSEYTRYSVTIVDSNPDSELVGKMLKQPLTSFDRHYASEGLNHDVFNVHY